MDQIRKVSKQDFFISYNMIFNMDLSCHAKLVYTYLCRCADSNSSSFPSRKTIASHCSISLSSMRNAMNELIAARLLSKQEQFRKNGSQTSNIYFIYSEPYENDPCQEGEETECDKPDEAMTQPAELTVDKVLNHQDISSEREEPLLHFDIHPCQNTTAPLSHINTPEVLPILSTTHKEVIDTG